jgi:Fe-S cluster assembly protein SufD
MKDRIAIISENEPAWLAELRQKAADDFASSTWSQNKYGLNVFVNPKSVPLPSAADLQHDEPVVHAPSETLVLRLEDALRDDLRGDILRKLFSSYDAHDRIAAFHVALADKGTFIHAHAGVKPEAAVTIDVVMNAGTRLDRSVIVAEPGSELTVIERTSSREPGGRRVASTHIFAAPGSKVTHISVQDAANDAGDFTFRRAEVGANASVTWIDCIIGGAYAKSRMVTDLTGEGASVGAKALFFGNGTQVIDVKQTVRHLASHTHSDLRSRGALADSSKAVFRGLVRVEKGTKGCIGNQREDILLLGARAEADAVPMLEIGTDDVRCGHGAAIGRIDREKLFYLMSRGLSEAAARRFLVSGFLAPIIADMRDEGLVDMVQCLIDERLDRAETR